MMTLVLIYASLKMYWIGRRANIKMRREHQGRHQLQPNTYYGYSAVAIVLRLRGERPLFATMHSDTETLVMI